MSQNYRIAQRLKDFPEWQRIRPSLKEQLRLPEWELERMGDEVVGDSLDLVEWVMAVEESFKIRLSV